MWLLWLSLLGAIVAGLGRQIAVFAKVEKGLWLFSNWRWVRVLLTSLSMILAAAGYLTGPSGGRLALFLLIVFLNAFSYFFEMPFFFPEIDRVKRIPAGQTAVAEDTEVIGVAVGDTSVAYPINEIVMPRHIVHDTIEDSPVLVSYCALCRSALAFESEIDGRRLYFKVAGVWRRNMIMIDVQSKSIWQQATGECIYGKYNGRQLTLLSGENTIWKSWQKKHPHSQYASEFAEARRGLVSRERMLAGLRAVTPRAGAPGYTDLKGLPKRETVFGVTVDGESRAYPLSRLEPGLRFRDHVGDVEVEFEYDGEAQYLSASLPNGGGPFVVEKHWWLGWKEFHPDTTIWNRHGDGVF